MNRQSSPLPCRCSLRELMPVDWSCCDSCLLLLLLLRCATTDVGLTKQRNERTQPIIDNYHPSPESSIGCARSYVYPPLTRQI